MQRLPEDDAGHRWQSTRIALAEQTAKLRHPVNGQGGQAADPYPDDGDGPEAA